MGSTKMDPRPTLCRMENAKNFSVPFWKGALLYCSVRWQSDELVERRWDEHNNRCLRRGHQFTAAGDSDQSSTSLRTEQWPHTGDSRTYSRVQQLSIQLNIQSASLFRPKIMRWKRDHVAYRGWVALQGGQEFLVGWATTHLARSTNNWSVCSSVV